MMGRYVADLEGNLPVAHDDRESSLNGGIMNGLVKTMATGAVVLSFALPAIGATRSQKRDGSCDGTPVKQVDRKRDGSGGAQQKQQGKKNDAPKQGQGMRDRKRDGTGK